MMLLKYLKLQLKRFSKLFPAVFIITAITVCAVLLAGLAFANAAENDVDFMRLKVGIVGDIDGSYAKVGIDYLKNADNASFFADFIEYFTEEEAMADLKDGVIAGYLSVPEGYFNDIYYGRNEPATYYTLGSATGIGVTLMSEVTISVSSMVTETQNGVQTMLEIADKYSLDNSNSLDLNLAYVAEVVGRENAFEVKLLGNSESISQGAYYVCAIILVLAFLWGISCHRLLARDNYATSKLLNSKGLSPTRQIVCEYLSFLAFTLIMYLFFAIVFALVWPRFDLGITELEKLSLTSSLLFVVKILPVIMMISFMQLMIYEMTGSGVGGTTLHFLIVVGMCYASGFFYPSYLLPKALRSFASFFPSGVAFSYLKHTLRGVLSINDFAFVLLYIALFASFSCFARRKAIGKA